MNTLEQTIRNVRRRGIVNEAVHRGGMGAAWGLAAGFAVLAIDRLAPVAAPQLVYYLLPALGMAVGIIHAVMTHPDMFAIALRIDRSMHLKDRVTTAHAITGRIAGPSGSGPIHDDGFAAVVNRDAERLAGRLDIRTIAPLRMSGTWGIAAGLAVVLWLGYAFLPSATWAADEPGPAREGTVISPEERERERDEMRQRIEESVEHFKRDLTGEDGAGHERELPVDPRVREQLDALERLAHQLSGEGAEDVDLDQARNESAARLSELAEQIAQDVRRDRETAERLTERFAGIEPPDTPMTAREFQEALRRGDFGRAADLLDDRLNRKNELAEEDRDDLARHLREMSEELDARSRKDEQQLEEREAQLEQVLRDYGLDDELIDDLLKSERLSQDELERLLREEGIDEELANRLARELDRLREESEVMDQVQRDAEAIRDTLRETVEELERTEEPSLPEDDLLDERDPASPTDLDAPDRPAADEEVERDDAPADDDPASHETDAKEQERDPDGREEPGEDDAGEPREPTEGEEGAEEAEESEEREVAEERSTDQPDAAQEAVTDDPDAEGGEQPVADPDDPDAAPEDPDAPDAPQPAEDETGLMDEIPQPGEQPGIDPGADPDAGDETIGEEETEGEMRQSPADRLREIDDRRRRSEQQEQISEEMIERALEMIEKMDPDQRRELAEQLQQQMEEDDLSPPEGVANVGGDEAGTEDAPVIEGEPRQRDTTEVEDIDLTPDDDEFDRVLAEWLSDEELLPDREGVQRSEVSEERVREARRIAERAVEDAAVPSRYHQVIRRYFQRLEERTESPDGE